MEVILETGPCAGRTWQTNTVPYPGLSLLVPDSDRGRTYVYVYQSNDTWNYVETQKGYTAEEALASELRYEADRDDAMSIARDLAESDPIGCFGGAEEDIYDCLHCVLPANDVSGMWRADDEAWVREQRHEPRCLWLRAKQLVGDA